MRAIIANHPGAPDVLHPITLPDPEPGPEQVRVAVEVAAITFIDTLIRAGSSVAPPATFPVALGNGVGGFIDRLGPGVDPDWIGATTTPALFALVRPGGRYVQHGAAGGSWGTIDPATAADKNITVIPLAAIAAAPEELFSLTERALDLAAQGTIRPIIGQTFPLDDAAAAHTAIGSRTTIGKTLLLP